MSGSGDWLVGDASRGKDIRWVNRRAAKWTPSLVHNATNPQKAVRDVVGGEERKPCLMTQEGTARSEGRSTEAKGQHSVR